MGFGALLSADTAQQRRGAVLIVTYLAYGADASKVLSSRVGGPGTRPKPPDHPSSPVAVDLASGPCPGRYVRQVPATTHDLVFVGGGLAALLLLRNLHGRLPARVAIVDPTPPAERPSVHWSYWSTTPTPYDRFALQVWRRARVAGGPRQEIAPFTMGVVRSVDVLTDLAGSLSEAGVDWVAAKAQTITRTRDGQYAVETPVATLVAPWVFDSACDVPPIFPSPRKPHAAVSGTGLRVLSDRATFDPTTATLFDPIDDRRFAYLLPLSPTEALLESASFGSRPHPDDSAVLLDYLRQRHPRVPFTVNHVENGVVPLGFAPSRTVGARHILLGSKRGLVKPSAGYGVVRIARESEHLARRWAEGRRVPATRRARWPWRLIDEQFVRMAVRDPSVPLSLLDRTMESVPLAQVLRLIDEDLPARHLLPLLRSAMRSRRP